MSGLTDTLFSALGGATNAVEQHFGIGNTAGGATGGVPSGPASNYSRSATARQGEPSDTAPSFGGLLTGTNGVLVAVGIGLIVLLVVMRKH